MTSLFTNKATNLTLRGITILLKFALSVIVIKELSVADYGVFGLFQSTIVILTFIIGFDFYTFSSREILKKNAKTFSFYFINQLVFHLLGYIFILPFTYFIFKLGIIDLKYASLFIVILISEHLSQELYRILIILNKTVVATMVLFFRSCPICWCGWTAHTRGAESEFASVHGFGPPPAKSSASRPLSLPCKPCPPGEE